MKTKTETLIKALQILVEDIQSEDGIANAAIAEAAVRLEQLHEENKMLRANNDLYSKELNAHVKAASIFQPNGKYAKNSYIKLGESVVVKGIEYLDQKVTQYQKALEEIASIPACLKEEIDWFKLREIAEKALDIQTEPR